MPMSSISRRRSSVNRLAPRSCLSASRSPPVDTFMIPPMEIASGRRFRFCHRSLFFVLCRVHAVPRCTPALLQNRAGKSAARWRDRSDEVSTPRSTKSVHGIYLHFSQGFLLSHHSLFCCHIFLFLFSNHIFYRLLPGSHLSDMMLLFHYTNRW